MTSHPSDHADAAGVSGPPKNGDEKAALEQVEPDRLLEGEDENTQHLDDAEHWVKVYVELLEFKRAVLATTEEARRHHGADASAEVQTD